MRIIGYVRLSRASRDESTSVVRQREVIRTTCSARGWELIDIVEDVDVSATKSRLNRPGLNALRARIENGDADAVMVWRLDRLVRSVVDVGVLLDGGLQIVSATESLDTTSAMGRAMVEILQVFASMEATTIGLRVSASQAHLRKIGRWPGGVLPYGYRSVPHPDGAGKALEPDPAEAAVVRRMADEVLDGHSVYAVTQRLNADGIPPRRLKLNPADPDGPKVAGTWSATSVQRILRSNAVLGRVKVNGELIRDESGVPIQAWTPLLTLEEIERLRVITDWTPTPGRSEATVAGRRSRATRLLSGLLNCAGCGGPLVVKSRKSTTGRPIYSCQAAARGKVCPRGVAVECDRIEAEVERQFLAIVGRFQVIEARASVREVAGLAAVVEAIRDTTDSLGAPHADLPFLFERLTKLHEERDRLSALPADGVVAMVETGETFGEVWAREDVAGRRRVIRSSGVTVNLAPAARRGFWDPSRIRLDFASAERTAAERGMPGASGDWNEARDATANYPEGQVHPRWEATPMDSPTPK
jgi:site-specific DNA recombinase